MQKVFTILIADRNPHVRSFLQREMIRDGFRVHVAETGRDLLEWVSNGESVDLIILDPDLPDAAAAELLPQIRHRVPGTPVVVHTHYPGSAPGPAGEQPGSFFVVEKSGRSIERLKQLATTLLESRDPGGPLPG